MFKDKDKQREANRQAQARFKAKGITKGITIEGITSKGITQIPKEQMCITDDWQKAIDTKPERTAQGNIRVSKPGETDYVPQCETTKSFTDLPNTETIPPVEKVRYKLPDVVVTKRGKDIKCFADLPPHVQETIHKMCMKSIGPNEAEFKRRTAIAINYQHQFPDRYHSTGAGADSTYVHGPLPFKR